VCPTTCAQKWRESAGNKNRGGCGRVATELLARKNPQSPLVLSESDGGTECMYRLWDAGVTKLHLAALVGVLCALVAIWLGFRQSSPELAQDFEDCVERVEAKLPSNDELSALMTDCNVRFAGRRKAEGGYTYYDFMQDRKFDIVGPNPTPEERKQIDREYIGYLDVQRREAVSAELAIRQNEQLRADIERARQAVGPPMILTPTNASAAKRLVDRPKPGQCGDDSLACTWSKISTAVKNAFASSKAKP
jgi:hypothetical protein